MVSVFNSEARQEKIDLRLPFEGIIQIFKISSGFQFVNIHFLEVYHA